MFGNNIRRPSVQDEEQTHLPSDSEQDSYAPDDSSSDLDSTLTTSDTRVIPERGWVTSRLRQLRQTVEYQTLIKEWEDLQARRDQRRVELLRATLDTDRERLNQEYKDSK